MTDMIPKESQSITRDKLKRFLPKGSSVQVTDEVLDMINNMERDTGLPQDLMEENLMSYMHLIGKIKSISINELANAMKFCTLKRNMTNKEAWAIVFPKKYDELVAANKQIDNHVSMYNSSKIVVEIDKQMIIPVYIQHNAYHHAAIKKQFELMNGNDGSGGQVSAMVMHLAAKELALITKMPEDKTIELKIGMSDAAMAQQQEMNDALSEIVANQAKMFAAGKSADEIQKIHTVKIIEEESVDVYAEYDE
jgi:hypothetical protein